MLTHIDVSDLEERVQMMSLVTIWTHKRYWIHRIGDETGTQTL